MTVTTGQQVPERAAGALPTAPATTAATWVRACRVDDVVPDRGVAALVASRQVALFVLRAPPGDAAATGGGGEGAAPEVYAVGNRDPYSGANVMARGLVGSAGDRPTVASPIYKQRFDLRDGTCLDGEEHLPAWPARVVGGWVEVQVGTPADR